MSHKIFDNDLVAIRKNKVTLMLNKPAYIGVYILDLSKVVMYKFHYDYIKIKMVATQVKTITQCLTLVIIQLSQKL